VEDIKFYFKDGVHPTQEFTNDSYSIPTFKINTATQIKVSFLYEGAGYRNQLGYVIWNTAADGTIISPGQEEILFPDASFDNNCLHSGDTVTSAGTIPAGSYIGFVLISNGCNGGTDKYYSSAQFNTPPTDRGLRHLASFVDGSRELVILGFEDLRFANSDLDFEDTMFVFDTLGVDVGYPDPPPPLSCVDHRGPCMNQGRCNFNAGICNCPGLVYGGDTCTTCSCDDGNPCTTDRCIGNPCLMQFWTDNVAACRSQQSCNFTRISGCTVTTGAHPTTGAVRLPTTSGT